MKDPSRLSIVGSATDLAEFSKTQPTGILKQELGLPEDAIVIANISAFVGFKDHYTFVDAAELISKKMDKAVFVLIGKGELEDDIKKYVAEKSLQDKILFLGFRTDIPILFPEFDLFLFTSKLEPTGGVLLEAYASMVPIVATRAAGIPEVVVENETGLLCEKENPVDFAEKAIQILTNPELAKKLTQNGYAHLLQNFTKEVIAEKMFEEIHQVYLNSRK
jgi:glycosyltransferase involved in cell wall biosynthesis